MAKYGIRDLCIFDMYCSFLRSRQPWSRMLKTRFSNYCHKLFVSNLAIEPHFLPCQPENLQSRNYQWSIKYKPTRKSPCLFVYRGTVCAICRTPNNRGIFLSPPVREPAISKVAKYGMTSVHCFVEQFRLMQPHH